MMILQGDDKTRAGSWHTYESMNVPEARVLTITVDGDELEWLLTAMRAELRLTGNRLNYPAERLTPIL